MLTENYPGCVHQPDSNKDDECLMKEHVCAAMTITASWWLQHGHNVIAFFINRYWWVCWWHVIDRTITEQKSIGRDAVVMMSALLDGELLFGLSFFIGIGIKSCRWCHSIRFDHWFDHCVWSCVWSSRRAPSEFTCC